MANLVGVAITCGGKRILTPFYKVSFEKDIVDGLAILVECTECGNVHVFDTDGLYYTDEEGND